MASWGWFVRCLMIMMAIRFSYSFRLWFPVLLETSSISFSYVLEDLFLRRFGSVFDKCSELLLVISVVLPPELFMLC